MASPWMSLHPVEPIDGSTFASNRPKVLLAGFARHNLGWLLANQEEGTLMPSQIIPTILDGLESTSFRHDHIPGKLPDLLPNAKDTAALDDVLLKLQMMAVFGGGRGLAFTSHSQSAPLEPNDCCSMAKNLSDCCSKGKESQCWKACNTILLLPVLLKILPI